MNNTSTIKQTSYGVSVIEYTNNETAIVSDDRIGSICLNSSAIGYWTYNTKTNGLTVQYKSSETFYDYVGVPFSTIFAPMNADSLGAFIAREIKPNFSVA